MNGLKQSVRVRARTLIAATTKTPLIAEPLAVAMRAGVVPSSTWRRLPVERTFRVTLSNGRSFAYHSTPDDAIGRSLFWRGLEEWEAETLRPMQTLAAQARVIVDVGANTGVYTLLACAANPAARVIAFEPVPYVFQLLRQNVELNDWLARCDLHNEAVSDCSGRAQMRVPQGSMPYAAGLHVESRSPSSADKIVDVPVTTIDSVCSDQEEIDLVKIDVEGFEDKVLAGMKQVLSTSTPTIIVECTPDGPYKAVEAILSRLGYRFYHLRSPRPVAIDGIVPDPDQVFRNFLCTVHDSWEILH